MTDDTLYSSENVLAELKLLITYFGSQSATARQLGYSPQYICDIMKGRRGISAELASRLGYKEVDNKFRKVSGRMSV